MAHSAPTLLADATVGLVALLAACSADKPNENRDVAGEQSPSAFAAESDHGLMWWSESIGDAEIERRLRAHVIVSNGLVILRDPFLDLDDTHVLPADSPWTIGCGFGVTVYFGTAVTGTGGDTGNIVTVMLLAGVIPREACEKIGLALGRALQTILAGS